MVMLHEVPGFNLVSKQTADNKLKEVKRNLKRKKSVLVLDLLLLVCYLLVNIITSSDLERKIEYYPKGPIKSRPCSLAFTSRLT